MISQFLLGLLEIRRQSVEVSLALDCGLDYSKSWKLGFKVNRMIKTVYEKIKKKIKGNN